MEHEQGAKVFFRTVSSFDRVLCIWTKESLPNCTLAFADIPVSGSSDVAAVEYLFNIDQGILNGYCQGLAFRAGNDVLIIALGKITASTGVLPEGQGFDMSCWFVLHIMRGFSVTQSLDTSCSDDPAARYYP